MCIYEYRTLLFGGLIWFKIVILSFRKPILISFVAENYVEILIIVEAICFYSYLRDGEIKSSNSL
jgi:hypothetical protein